MTKLTHSEWLRLMDPALQTDDELREKLAYHGRNIEDGKRRYGSSAMSFDRSLLDEIYDKAKPWQDEAARRGITS